ncbi:MAG: histidine kinase [Bacteroidetes bacterium]|jgi:signal transduction histidine kinase|nr:histidine kinase [Bacteroidota bacterium]
MKLELQAPALESEAQIALVENHSFLNIMNVLIGELYYLSLELGDHELLKPAIDLCDKIKNELMDRSLSLNRAKAYAHDRQTIETLLGKVLEKQPGLAKENLLAQDFENIRNVLDVLEVRAAEIVERGACPDAWLRFTCRFLENDLKEFFLAVLRNAKGKYGIVFNQAEKGATDYLINLYFRGNAEQDMWMPLIVKDTIRDLAANARKYTLPGGQIDINVAQDAENLSISVSDTGIGIPWSELPSVIAFGYRASNASAMATRGGGFGLTKAAVVTKNFGGRMWIDSKENQGTEVCITLPLPPYAR